MAFSDVLHFGTRKSVECLNTHKRQDSNKNAKNIQHIIYLQNGICFEEFGSLQKRRKYLLFLETEVITNSKNASMFKNVKIYENRP